MKDILFLPHRMPYPPNKGDKIRSFHILQQLSKAYRVHIATFVDDPDDMRYCDEVRAYVDEAFFCPLSPKRAKIRSAAGLIDGRALSIPYYHDRRMAAWIDDLLRRRRIDGIFVFSSVMAQYACDADTVVDFVDVDSEKWRSYAEQSRWPMSWVYAREARRLLAFERQVAATCRRAIFVSDNEAALFRQLAPESGDKVLAMDNGVDSAYFLPESGGADPFPSDIEPLVFTGAMNYWPNVDAVRWFCGEVLPALRQQRPRLRLYIVGAQPSPEVTVLDDLADVTVTGTVPDVRPYLAHARLVVVPLRIARGVQNKILEAMAMAKPLVVSPEAMCGIGCAENLAVDVAQSVDEWINAISRLDSLPREAPENRRFIESRYDWITNLQPIDSLWH